MFKIPQARFQQHVNQKLPDVQTEFRKGTGTRDHIANIRWIIEKVRESPKNISFCLIDYSKAFVCVDHNFWKILKEMETPDYLICHLRNLYAGQEATVRTGHGTTDWYQVGKGVHQGCILSPCLFNLYALVYHVKCQVEWSTGWNQDYQQKYQELQICRWHHPYGRKQRGTKGPLDDSERGELKSWLRTQHSKNEDHGNWSHQFMANRWGNNGNSGKLYFLGLQNHWRWWMQTWN